MSQSPLILNNYERKAIMEIFHNYTLWETYTDDRGYKKQKFMRNRVIWINDKDFLKKNKSRKSILSLVKKNIIRPHIFAFKMSIKKEYLHQIYSLADNEDFNLIEQLIAIWVEVGN